MKRRIGTIKGKPIIEGGDTNILTNNEILVQNNKIIARKDNELKELGNNNNSNSSFGRLFPSDITSIEQQTFTMDNYAMPAFDKTYDISFLINYSEELGVFTISETDYNEIKQRDSYSKELYFNIRFKDGGLTYNPVDQPDIEKSEVHDDSYKSHIFYYSIFNQSRLIKDFKNNYREFYLMVL